MEVGKKFANITLYNEHMAKGLEDKMFFLEHLPKDPQGYDRYLFVDFGCADGTLINAMYQSIDQPSTSKYFFMGYDISEQMISLARTKMSESPKNVVFTSDWKDVQDKIKDVEGNLFFTKKVLILNSVVHEVFSYATGPKDIFDFWDKVLNSGFDYICIRDMMVPSDTHTTPSPVRWLEQIKLNRWKVISEERFNEFEKIWGPVNNKQILLHFLLKYRWQINWDREVHENYFPIDIEDFLMKFEDNYNLDYFKRFRVPFIDEKLKEDLNITLHDTDSTHIKVIFSIKSNV